MATDGEAESLPAATDDSAHDFLYLLVRVGLLGRVWPQERVVVGMRVCRWLLRELPVHVPHSQLVFRSPDKDVRPEHVAACLQRFAQATVLLSATTAKSVKTVVNGILSGAESGCGQNVKELHLQGDTGAGLQWGAALGAAVRACPRLVRLDLQGRMVGEGAEEVARAAGELGHLTTVQLRGYCFANAGKPLLERLAERCRGLVALNMADALLQPAAGAALATVLLQCRKLERLELNNNPLKDNGIEALCKGLATATQLQRLALSSTSVGQQGAKALGDALHTGGAGLRSLDVSWNPILAEGMGSLARGLHGCGELREVEAMHNLGGSEGVRRLAAALRGKSKLTRLGLERNQFEEEGATYLAATLELQKLQRLSLKFNAVRATGMRALGAALPCGRLQRLDLRQCQLGDVGATELSMALGRGVEVEELWLSVNEVGPPGFERLAAALQASAVLRELDLAWNRAGPEGGRALAQLQGRGLERVDLYQCHLDDEGARAVGGAMGRWSMLREVMLSENRVGVAAGRAVLGSLRRLSRLQRLSVAGNALGAEGARELAEAVGGWPELVQLDVGVTGLGDEGVCALAGALGGGALTHLNVGDNNVQQRGASTLAEMLPQMARLRHLVLGGNEIGEEGAEALGRVLGRCGALEFVDVSECALDEAWQPKLQAETLAEVFLE